MEVKEGNTYESATRRFSVLEQEWSTLVSPDAVSEGHPHQIVRLHAKVKTLDTGLTGHSVFMGFGYPGEDYDAAIIRILKANCIVSEYEAAAVFPSASLTPYIDALEDAPA